MARHCACGQALASGTRGTRCIACYTAATKKPPNFCPDCSAPIGRDSKRCRPCALARLTTDPDIQAKRTQAIKQAYSDPALRKLVGERMTELSKRPDLIEKRREAGRANYHRTLGSPKGRAGYNAPETRRKISASISRNRLRKAGVPIEYRERYLYLLRSKGLRAMDAAEMVRSEAKAAEIGKLAAVHSESAAHFLRRYTAVMRTDDGWRYGTAFLSSEQLIERAMQKGWEPERWAA